MPALIMLLLALYVVPMNAQAESFQQDWKPNDYRFTCNGESGNCVLDTDDQRYVIDLLKQAVNDFSATEFLAPTWWAERRKDESTGEEYIELLEAEKNQVAHVGCDPHPETGYIKKADMSIGGKFEYLRQHGADHLSYGNLVHELFHLSQYEYPFWNPAKCWDFGGTPVWLAESFAQAVGIHMMIKRFPSDWPPRRSESEVVEFAGLRRYDKPLPTRIMGIDGKELKKGDSRYYITHSFWRHIAEIYHADNIGYLAAYMRRPQPAGDDWISWLKGNTESVTGVSLEKIFSGFLADYAGWASPGYPGEYLGLYRWLQGAFGGCEKVYLDKNNRHSTLELEILPLAGKCIEVEVAGLGDSGLEADESASIQILGEAKGDEQHGLYLSLAASNDSTLFMCAKEARSGARPGIGRCLFEEREGGIDLDGVRANGRVWNVKPQWPGSIPMITSTSGGTAELRQMLGPGQGSLVNRYIVSNIPPSVSSEDTKLGGRNPVKVRLHFVLDALMENASMKIGESKMEVPDIAETLPIKFDHHQITINRGQHEKRGEEHIGRADSEGLVEPCHMTANFIDSNTGDSMNMVIMQSGPFTPGEYEFANRLDIADKMEYSYMPERRFPGMVLGGYVVGPGNPPEKSRNKSYLVTSGTLTIDSIAGSTMLGRVIAYGSHRKWSEERRRKEVVEQTAVAARFAVNAGGYATGRHGNKPYACLLPQAPDKQKPVSPGTERKGRPEGSGQEEPGGLGKQPQPAEESGSEQQENGVPAIEPGSQTRPPASTAVPESEGKGNNSVTEQETGKNRSDYLAAEGSNRLYIRATGDIQYENVFVIPKRTSTRELLWNCSGSGLRAGYSWGKLMSPDWESLVFAVETPVAPGQTGTFSMRGMTWNYGQEPMPGQPVDSPFKMARKFEGAGGELRLTSHIATSKRERRIQGLAKAQVRSKDDDLKVQLHVEFDLRKSCGLLP